MDHEWSIKSWWIDEHTFFDPFLLGGSACRNALFPDCFANSCRFQRQWSWWCGQHTRARRVGRGWRCWTRSWVRGHAILGFAGPSFKGYKGKQERNMWESWIYGNAVKNVSSNFVGKIFPYCSLLQIPRHRSFVCQDSGCDGRLLDSWDQPEASAAQDLPKHQGWELVARSHSVDDGWLHGMRGMIVGNYLLRHAVPMLQYNPRTQHSHDLTWSNGIIRVLNNFTASCYSSLKFLACFVFWHQEPPKRQKPSLSQQTQSLRPGWTGSQSTPSAPDAWD